MENELKQKTLFILDSYGLIYREYYAFIHRPLTNDKGENISAVHGVFNNLALTLRNLKPDMFVVALDSKTPTFRHEMYSEYKANRSATPDDLKSQFPLIEDVLATLKMPFVRVDGFEADDIIATLAKKASAENYKVFVLSNDKDLLQLVDDNVHILRSGKKDKSKMWEEVDSEIVKEEWGVEPSKICDILSLIGDTADNVPGVKGVGEKTAVKYISQYGSLDELYNHSSEIKGSIGEKIRNGKDDAFFSKKLISLNYDVPFDIDYDSFSVSNLDYKNAASKLSDFSLSYVSNLFFGLSESQNLENEKALVQKNQGEYKFVTSKAELDEFIKNAKNKVVAFDTETDSLNTRIANLVGFSLSFEEHKGIYVPLICTNEESQNVALISKNDACEALKTLFETAKTLVMHNAKYDLQVLFYNFNFENKESTVASLVSSKNSVANKDLSNQFDLFSFDETENANENKNDAQNDISENENEVNEDKFDDFFKTDIFDTMIAAWVLEPDRSEKNAYSLESLAEKKLRLSGVEFYSIVEKDKTFDSIPLDVAANYSAEDSDFTLQLYNVLNEELKQNNLTELFNSEMKILPVLSKMEIRGIHIDSKILRKYNSELFDALQVIQEDIYKIAGHRFNISSTRQLCTVLFDEMGLKGKRKTKTGSYSTDEESLQALSDNEIVQKILDYRGKTKLLSTYVEPLPALADEDSQSRIHTSFMQTGTATGRLSSRDPNLQNIPIREEEGRRIRSAFTAQEGKVLISADYAQIELVVLAHLSNDENLCKAFNDGVDVHKSTASLIYNVPMEEVTADQRRHAKTFNFGIMYGMGAYRLSSDLKISFHEADEFIKTYFEVYSGVKTYFEKTVKDAEESGFTQTISGRKREIKNITSSTKVLREAAVRIAKNSPIQGSAADIVKKAMLDIDKALKETPTGAKMLLQVHDELIFECDDNEESISNTIALIKDKMEHAFHLAVPLRVSVEVGKNWGEFH